MSQKILRSLHGDRAVQVEVLGGPDAPRRTLPLAETFGTSLQVGGHSKPWARMKLCRERGQSKKRGEP